MNMAAWRHASADWAARRICSASTFSAFRLASRCSRLASRSSSSSSRAFRAARSISSALAFAAAICGAALAAATSAAASSALAWAWAWTRMASALASCSAHDVLGGSVKVVVIRWVPPTGCAADRRTGGGERGTEGTAGACRPGRGVNRALTAMCGRAGGVQR